MFFLLSVPQLASRSGRECRPSGRVVAQSKIYYTYSYFNLLNFKLLLLVHEEQEAIARKEELIRRRTERERAKAQKAQDATGNIPDEDEDEREERHSGTVCRLPFSIYQQPFSFNPVYFSYGSVKTFKFNSSYQESPSKLFSHHSHGMCTVF